MLPRSPVAGVGDTCVASRPGHGHAHRQPLSAWWWPRTNRVLRLVDGSRGHAAGRSRVDRRRTAPAGDHARAAPGWLGWQQSRTPRGIPPAPATRNRREEPVADTDIETLTRASLPADWTDLDQRAVDTIRVLAADAVQKVGNGHPGTAMSLAPLAYTLFQRVMRHDPTDPDWIGRDRFVLSAGHSSLTLYIQLYLSGYGLELDDLEGAAHLGLEDPRPPRAPATPAASRSPPARSGQGLASAVGMAMAARRERGLFDPDAAPGESPFDHHIYVIASDGDIEEGVTSEASSLAGHPAAGQPHRDLRRQQDLHRGRHHDRAVRGHREALRGLRLARAGRRGRRERHRHPRRAREREGARPTGRRSSCCARSSASRRRTR